MARRFTKVRSPGFRVSERVTSFEKLEASEVTSISRS